jgi:hypothetical protein
MTKRNLIVIPYGTPDWGIASPNMKSVLSSIGTPTDVAYLLPLWGLIDARDYHSTMLSGYAHLRERDLLKQTGLMVRSWLLHKGIMYNKIVLLNYGQSMKFWNIGVQQTPLAKKITIIRFLPSKSRMIKKIVRNLNEDRSKNNTLTAKEKTTRFISNR